MVLGTKQRIIAHDKEDNQVSITYNGIALSRVRSTKCLGVIIDEKLSWNEHIDYICKKVFASLSMLRRIKPFLERKDMNLLYNCLIQSQLDYCCEVWGSRYDTHIKRLEILQKRAARMILNVNYFTPSIELFKDLNWLPFHKRVMYFRCVFIHKCLNNLSSEFFSNTFLDVSITHSFNTRHAVNGNLVLPKCNTEYLKKSFIYSAISLWNSLPNDLKMIDSVFCFKGKFKKYLMS